MCRPSPKREVKNVHDFDYDVMQKKRIARGAAHRKRGTKSKKCTLPSDYLTKKELKALDGEVKTYNIHQRLTYTQFKELPDDLATDHINWLIETFGCNAEAIGRSLGVSKGCVFVWTKSHNMKLTYRRFMPSKEWLTFLGEMPVVEEVVEEATEPNKPVDETPEPETVAPARPTVEFLRGSLVLSGPKDQVLRRLFEVLPDTVAVNVEFTAEEGD